MNHWNKVKRRIAKLATKALKDKPKLTLPKGAMHLKDVNIGQLVKVYNSYTEGIILNKTPSSVTVYVTKHKSNDPFYMNEQRWGLTTEVEIVK
jgi:hypothetical protein|tara:strand:- start:5721 stop:5999 length:279 start_codon:yes stop_codon:yes gene_type:complete